MADKPYRFSYEELLNILQLCAVSTEPSPETSESDPLTTELAQEVKDVIADKVGWAKGYAEEDAKRLLLARKGAREVANKLKLAKEQVKAVEEAAKAARVMLENAKNDQREVARRKTRSHPCG